MARFFTSDHHFWHTNVIRYCGRPYGSIEEMNEDLVLKWNQTVRPDDEVFYIGDFSMAFRAVETFTRRLMGTKHLICGNHDFCHPSHKKSRKPEGKATWVAKYLQNGWASVQEQMELELIGGQKVLLCHLPYQPAPGETEEDFRHLKHRPIQRDDQWLLCGHVHEKWKIKGRQVNVGVDVWGMAPVSEDQILWQMAQQA